MSKWGDCNFDELIRLQQNIANLEKQKSEFCEDCAKELAARLLAKIVKRTPVGQYPAGSGKKGGTLRRGWNKSKGFKVTRVGDMFQVELVNPVLYATYVEYGHRTANHSDWVNGKFMMTLSEQELQNQAPRIIENKLKKYLEGCVNGK